MSNKWGITLAVTCWSIAGGLALFNLIDMGLRLAGSSDFISFYGGRGTIVVQTFINIIWQAGIFTVAGLGFFSVKRND